MVQTELQQKTLAYIGETQPLIEKFAAAQTAYRTKAAEVAPVFVRNGLIADVDQKKFTEKLASDPSVALDYLVKLAGMFQAETLGAPTDSKLSVALDPFERWIMYGDPNANPGAFSPAV